MIVSWLKRNAPVIAGVSVSGLLLYLAIRGVDLREAMHSVAGANVAWIPVLAAIILLDLGIRSARWKILLRDAAPQVRLWPLVRLESIGLAINNVLFLRLGEVARGILAARELSIPVFSALASIFIERLLDTMALCAIFSIAAYLHPELVRADLGLMTAGLAAGIALFLGILSWLESVPMQQLFHSWPKVHSAMSQIMLGARPLRSPVVVVQVVCLSFALWLADASLYWIGAKALSLVPEVTYGRAVFVLASAAASAILPAVPGAFGVFEQVVKVLLQSFGVDGAAALGYAAFIHIVNYAIVTGLGIFFLYRQGLTFGRLKAMSSEAAR